MTIEEIETNLRQYEQAADNDPCCAGLMLDKLQVRKLLAVAKAVDKVLETQDIIWMTEVAEALYDLQG